MLSKKDGVWIPGVFFAVSLAVYFLSLNHYFINDDLIHLEFVKNFHGRYLDFLFPHLRPSDVVTHARYEPFHILFYAFLYKLLGGFFPAYQLLHIAVHALNAFLIYKIGKKLNPGSAGAFLAGLFFCVYRLNSQEVLWYASLFCTFTITLLLSAFLLYLRQNGRSCCYSVLLFLGAVLLSLRAHQFLLFAAAYFLVFRKDLLREGLLKLNLMTLAGYGAAAAFSIAANAVSWRYFPNEIPGFEADVYGFFVFFLNLVCPYEVSIPFKAAMLLLFCAAVILHRKERAVVFLASAVVLNALFWTFMFSSAHLPYAPRYLYWAAVPFCLLLGHFTGLAFESGVPYKRLCAIVLAVLFAGGNAFFVGSQDIVWFRYLSVRGQKLDEVSRLAGTEKKKVFIQDDFFSNDPNLDYFKDKLAFVSAAEAADFTVDLERGRYVKYFGRDFGKEYWHQPWFIKKPCREDTPWC